MVAPIFSFIRRTMRSVCPTGPTGPTVSEPLVCGIGKRKRNKEANKKLKSVECIRFNMFPMNHICMGNNKDNQIQICYKSSRNICDLNLHMAIKA